MTTTAKQLDTVRVVINGDEVALPGGTSVGTWLARADRDPRTVAVERNGEILPRARYDETVLVDGDRLEVVQFVQGG